MIIHNNQRVLTTAQLSESFGTETKIISKNFERNEERYTEGKHYYILQGQELKNFKATRQIDDNLKFAPILYLWTEKGAWMHAKSLNTDRAWEAYEMLVDEYYRIKDVPTLSANEAIAIALQQTAEMMNKLPEIEFKIENVERKLDTQITLDSGQQYRLQKAVRKKVCSIEPDKEARKPLFRQLNGEIRDRWGVPSVRDVLKTDFVDVIRYVDAWIPKKTVTVTPVINSLDDPSPSELGQKIEQQLKCDMEKMF
ncbi:putative phage anti-repressor [Paenibacillus larvae subsp. larvae DSM 25430]|uniref:Putative phage anti-repressor n=1 Tax=Paenibacillus larvae subsp. larvae DSM 25430 TaxID=697284 RepID=V9W4M3_9BACL|nr:putative phage anti-repressor [Paenibacillus larvae subsp. larvae DSM 25430]